MTISRTPFHCNQHFDTSMYPTQPISNAAKVSTDFLMPTSHPRTLDSPSAESSPLSLSVAFAPA